MLNVLLFTILSFDMKILDFLIQSLLIAFYCFVCLSYLYTILKKNTSNSLPTILFLIMIINIFLLRYKNNLYILLIASTIVGLVASGIRVYKKRQKIIRKKEEIDKELDDDWSEEPHLLFEESEIGKLV